MSYKGRIVDCVYGLETGSKYKIISEPYNINRKGDKAVDVIDMQTGEKSYLELKDILYSIYYELLPEKEDSNKNKEGYNISQK